MPTQSKNLPLDEFLAVTAGSKDIGLIIAKDVNELERLTTSLGEKGFKHSENVSSLLTLKKAYLVIDENAAKDAYDFAAQYSTGQIEVFDKEQMQSQTFSPDYDNLSLVFVVDKDNLNKLQMKGFDLLSAVGPAFQS